MDEKEKMTNNEGHQRINGMKVWMKQLIMKRIKKKTKRRRGREKEKINFQVKN